MRQQILTISLCCVFILSALSDVLSQPLHRTDLSNLRVNAFAQDSLGYIWIATANGLCKSFGESYDVFFYDEADEHSIPSNLITGLYVDDASKLWISGRVSVRWRGGSTSFTDTRRVPRPVWKVFFSDLCSMPGEYIHTAITGCTR